MAFTQHGHSILWREMLQDMRMINGIKGIRVVGQASPQIVLTHLGPASDQVDVGPLRMKTTSTTNV